VDVTDQRMDAYVVFQDGCVDTDQYAAMDVPWWSFTKTVIAAAALVLVDEGRLALDQPLGLEGYTLRQLLQHRAGLPDYGPVAAYHAAVARHDDAWTPAELLERARARELVFRPGQGWAYSNIGYLLVRRQIEWATGVSLGEALARVVLRPLGIRGPRVAMRRDDLANVEMGTAEHYDPQWVYHGLLVGTLKDAAFLLHGLMSGGLLPRELQSAMLDAHPLPGEVVAGRPWTSPGYGLGLMISGTVEGNRLAGHTGVGPGSVIAVFHSLSSRGTRTAAAFSPGSDPGVVESRCATLLRGGAEPKS
jgi:CubicO group peptidase (beta-lactamase class C family)